MPEIQEAVPKYLQIANFIKNEIVRGDRKPGEEIPSERQIALEWSVARPTAAKALNALRVQGLVESRQGSGTYVRDPQAAIRARERYQRARKFGRIHATGDYAEIKSAEVVDAPDYVRETLALKENARVVRRQRVTFSTVDGPVESSVSWLDANLVEVAPRLVKTERIKNGTVRYVEEVTGRNAAYARDQVAARLATDEEARDLNLGGEGSAVLVYRHTVYDTADQPLEFAEAVYPPNRWTFEQKYSVTE
ncbi:GntR family transcriptional regulator [Kibdelosporangium banguiense]|uniref:GntR family transcriptional regulator n=1 Tax=Kibdelosporangium banguiense TaxID=1365924 RepID=A0ABS4U1D8_9PSEU|nr:GntR family transcriptional regulator [Kibdelosporangium banguiense]MBP2330456.1 GntR family transcriptional regulator [Kibdelosporangium banguiense]